MATSQKERLYIEDAKIEIMTKIFFILLFGLFIYVFLFVYVTCKHSLPDRRDFISKDIEYFTEYSINSTSEVHFADFISKGFVGKEWRNGRWHRFMTAYITLNDSKHVIISMKEGAILKIGETIFLAKYRITENDKCTDYYTIYPFSFSLKPTP